MAITADAARPGKDVPRAIFSRDALMFALYAGIIPNAVYILATPFFLAERMIGPALYLLAAILALFLPAVIAFPLFILAMVADICLMVMAIFSLRFNVLVNSLGFVSTLDIKASGFYMAILAAALALTSLSAWLVIRNRHRLRGISYLPALTVVSSLLLVDWAYTYPYFKKTMHPFESAVSMNGITADGVAAKGKNLLIITVEGLGAYARPEQRAHLEKALTDGLPAGRYRVSSGNTYYYGSTTGAASRELCGRWGDYMDYLFGESYDCLPAQFADKGMETIAYHAFRSKTFLRFAWYPKIGFNELNFDEELVSKHSDLITERCGTVFLGLCDTQVGDVVHERLRSEPEKKKFIYWLTLNTHIPFQKGETDHLACRSNPAIGDDTVCELTNLWIDVFRKANAIASDPSVPPTDILIVGDHHTPLWSRAAKHMFIKDKVDWFYLEAASPNLALTVD